MESSVSTTDISEIKRIINELYDNANKTIDKHEHVILNEIHAIKKEQMVFYNKVIELISKSEGSCYDGSNNNNNNNNGDSCTLWKTPTEMKGGIIKKMKSKSPLNRNVNVYGSNRYKGGNTKNESYDFKRYHTFNNQNKVKEINNNSNSNYIGHICYSPSKQISSFIKRTLKHKINNTDVNNNNAKYNSPLKKKTSLHKIKSPLNRNNTNHCNSNGNINNKDSKNILILNQNQLNNDNKKISLSKLERISKTKNVGSSDLVHLNKNNNELPHKECIVLQEENIIAQQQQHQPNQTEMRKLSIIDIPFANTKIQIGCSDINNIITTNSLVDENSNECEYYSNDSFISNTNNDSCSIIKVIGILIKSDILTVKQKLMLCMLNKNIYKQYTPCNVIAEHVLYLNKCILNINNKLINVFAFVPSCTAQVVLQFITLNEEELIYTCDRCAKAIYLLICCDSEMDMQLEKECVVKKIKEIQQQRKLSELLLNVEVLKCIREMDYKRCKVFMEVIDGFSNGNSKCVGNCKRVMFYLNEVYQYFKKKCELNKRKEELGVQLKKCQDVEIVFKLRK